MELKSLNDVSTKVKSFWDRKEGTTGMVVIAAIVIALWWFNRNGDTLAHMFDNMEHIIWSSLKIAGIIFLLVNKRVRMLFELGMRAITQFFVELNPIAIMKNYLDGLENDREEMNNEIDNLSKQKGVVDGSIDENNAKIKECLENMAAAKAQGNAEEMELNQNEIGLAQEFNEDLKKMSADVTAILAFLEKTYKNIGFFIAKERKKVEYREKAYNIIKAASSALKSAMKAIKGDRDDKMMADMALEAVKDDMYKKVGQMKRTINSTKEFSASIDVQNAKYNIKAMEMLKEYESKGYDAFITDVNDIPLDKPVMVEARVSSLATPGSSSKSALLD